MNPTPHALLLKFPGTNCEAETARALELAGFRTTVTPIAHASAASLDGVDLVVFSGGFSYGDYVMSGRIAQLVTESKLATALPAFVAAGGYVLGICNGFQILTKLGLLPAGALIENTTGRFMCQWVKLRVQNGDHPCLAELPTDVAIEFPMAHAEGRFVAPAGEAERLRAEGLAALTYEETPNGSQADIAGLSDATGRVFGLMPHPERFIFKNQHYNRDWSGDDQWGWGYYFFKSLWRSVSGSRQLLATA